MSWMKKLLVLKNELGLALMGLLFACIGSIVAVTSEDGATVPLVFAAIGLVLFAIGLMKVVKELKTPTIVHKQYDKIQPETEPPVDFVRADGFEETEEDFVFHFTGKANQSYVMEDHNGAAVYEATTDKVLMLKARPYVFRNCMNGQEQTKMVGAPLTISMGANQFFTGLNISSSFQLDSQDVWEAIASQGYGFTFSLHGAAAHYEVRRWNKSVGFAELGGTGLVNPKYKDSPLGKVPTNGIFKVHCKRSDVAGLFLICFAITQTELTIE